MRTRPPMRPPTTTMRKVTRATRPTKKLMMRLVTAMLKRPSVRMPPPLKRTATRRLMRMRMVRGWKRKTMISNSPTTMKMRPQMRTKPHPVSKTRRLLGLRATTTRARLRKTKRRPATTKKRKKTMRGTMKRPPAPETTEMRMVRGWKRKMLRGWKMRRRRATWQPTEPPKLVGSRAAHSLNEPSSHAC